MPATHKPDTPDAKSIQTTSPAVTGQRFAEEYLFHKLAAIDIDSSVIDYVIFDNGILKIQILLSMT